MEAETIDIDNPLEYIPEYLKVIDKQGNLVPFRLKPLQEFYIKNRTHRDLILKGRQMGSSTGVQGANAHVLFTQPFQRHAVITHDTETSEFLLQNIHRFHRHLPPEMQPEVDWASSTRIRFPKLDNYIYIDSAKSESVGIGHTLNRVHVSEISRWPDKKARQLWADITQTVPLEGFVTAESTPRGRVGIFFELWTAAKKGDIPYKTFFFPWWWEPEYTIKVEKTLTYSKEEQGLVDNFHLNPGQIAYRRMKQQELKDLFYQEYPESDIDCWLSNDIGVVDPVSLKPYFTQIRSGTQEGNLTMWKGPVGGRKYVMGVDVAGGHAKGDFSVASVLDCRTMEYVARLRGRIPPDMFAEQAFNLGIRYNHALVAIEKMAHGHTVLRIFLEKDYPNMYYYVDYDEIRKETLNEPGWKTSVRTKPMMINDLTAAFRSQDLISWSENLLEEASSLVWEGDKKVKTVGGSHDDEWDAVAIALQVREQTPIIEEQRAAVGYYAR